MTDIAKPIMTFNRYLDRSNIGNIRNVAELASCVENGYDHMKNPMRVQIIVQEADWLHGKEFPRKSDVIQHNDDCPAKNGKPVCICPQHRRYA